MPRLYGRQDARRYSLFARVGAIVLLVSALAAGADAAEADEVVLRTRFAGIVHPFLKTYCLTCHSKEKPKGQLDLSRYWSIEAVVTIIGSGKSCSKN